MDEKTFDDMNSHLSNILNAVKSMESKDSSFKSEISNTLKEISDYLKQNNKEEYTVQTVDTTNDVNTIEQPKKELGTALHSIIDKFNYASESMRTSKFDTEEMISGVASNIGSFGSAIGSVTPKFSPWQVALELGTKALQEFARYVGEGYMQFQHLSEIGQDLGGAFGSLQVIGALRLDFEEFNGLLQRSNYLFNALGSEGMKDFSDNINSLLRDGSIQQMGFTASQVSKQLSDYYEIQLLQGNFDRTKLKSDTKAQRKYLKSVDSLAEATGQSRDEISSAFKDLIKNNSDVTVSMQELQRQFGERFDIQGVTMSLQNAFGLTGEQIASLHKAQTTGIYEGISRQMAGAVPQFISLYQELLRASADGLSTAEIQDKINVFLPQMQLATEQFQKIGRTDISNVLLTMINTMVKFNEDTTKPIGNITKFISELDTIFGGMGAAFKSNFAKFWSDFDTGKKGFYEAYSDAVQGLTRDISELLDIELPDKGGFMDLISEGFDRFLDNISSFIISIPDMIPEADEIQDIVSSGIKETIEIISSTMLKLGKFIATTLFDIDTWVSITKGLFNIITGIVGGLIEGISTGLLSVVQQILSELGFETLLTEVKTFSDNISTFFENYMVNIQNTIDNTFKGITEWFNTMYNSITNWMKDLLPDWLTDSEKRQNITSEDVASSASDMVDSISESISGWFSNDDESKKQIVNTIKETEKVSTQVSGGKMNSTSANIKKESIIPEPEKMKPEIEEKEPEKSENPSMFSNIDTSAQDATLQTLVSIQQQALAALSNLNDAIDGLSSGPRTSL